MVLDLPKNELSSRYRKRKRKNDPEREFRDAARNPLAAALSPRLLRWGDTQKARPGSALGES